MMNNRDERLFCVFVTALTFFVVVTPHDDFVLYHQPIPTFIKTYAERHFLSSLFI